MPVPIVTWLNLLAREEASLSVKGWEFHKRCVVSGIGNMPTATRLRAAVQQLANLNIYIGASFAVFDAGVPTAKCESITPRALAPDSIELDVIYREHFNNPNNPSFGVLELGCSCQQVTTNKDYQDNPLQLVYTGDGTKVSAEGQRTASGNWKTQQGTASVLRPQGTLSFSRQESSSPGFKQRTYVGTVNDGAWAADPSASARQWLCTEISGRTRDGNVYEVTYQFQYRSPNWDETVVWIDSGTGKPPNDFLTAGGIKTFQVYKTNNFNALALV